jgi:A/G-specific adenine glycosylase
MELGALVCTPRQAKCEICPLQSLCTAHRQGLVETLPNLGARPVTTARRFAACVLEQDGQFLVRQRPAGVVNAHLWEFPNVEIPVEATMPALQAALEAGLNCSLQSLSLLLTVKHAITRYRITLDVFRAQLLHPEPAGGSGVWMKKSELLRRSFTSAHRRVINKL